VAKSRPAKALEAATVPDCSLRAVLIVSAAWTLVIMLSSEPLPIPEFAGHFVPNNTKVQALTGSVWQEATWLWLATWI